MWTRSLQLGNEDQPHERSTTVENGMFNTNITGRGRSSPWGDGRKSPPMSTPQPDKNNSNSHVKPRVSTSSSKRTSLWGLSAVCGFNFTLFLLVCLSSCGGGNVCRHLLMAVHSLGTRVVLVQGRSILYLRVLILTLQFAVFRLQIRAQTLISMILLERRSKSFFMLLSLFFKFSFHNSFENHKAKFHLK